MKDDFASLYAFNHWANGRMLDACRQLTPEQYVAEPVPGWSSVRSTVYHIAIVTEGWLRSVAGETVESVLAETDLPTVDDALRVLDRAPGRDRDLADAHDGTARNPPDLSRSGPGCRPSSLGRAAARGQPFQLPSRPGRVQAEAIRN